MGRIKGFFCSFCLNRTSDGAVNDQSFSQDIDVSHLATPHITSSLSPAIRSSNATPSCDNESNENFHLCPQQVQPQNSIQNSLANQQQFHSDRLDGPYSEDAGSSTLRQQDNRIQPSPPTPARSPLNHYEPQAPQPSPEPPNHPPRVHNAQVAQQQENEFSSGNNNLQGTKLSYDIISVREPLAKILAERQMQQAQQRQILGDHEYIEVYGERGSSCFYEEIAGSTTSSAAYDQIGGPPNHNYQVLVNSGAIANRTRDSQGRENDRLNHDSTHTSEPNNEESEENVYDVTDSNGLVSNSHDEVKSALSFNPNAKQLSSPEPSSSQSSQPKRNSVVSQSIPVYSVINKGARRSNAIIRATVDNRRPPQPPPKNLFSYQPSTSAIQTYQEHVSSLNNHNPSTSRSSPQVPGTSSYDSDNSKGLDHHPRLPRPPPRFSKHPMYTAKNRPLPLPDKFEHCNTDNETMIDRDLEHDEDMESLNNGYELLNPNFDDDQIDVGYEKIRESNRYSGGSISSQFSPLQVLDNGGYESVQPIYSSPSNALAEPNYEAIGSATASELAAAATAKLTAIEQTAIFKRE